MGKMRARLTVMLSLLLLGACAADPLTINRVPRQPDADPPAPAAAEAAAETPSVSQAKPDIPEIVEPEPQVAAVTFNLDKFKQRLIGLDGEKVVGLLGAPDFERAERPAKIWQYRSDTCIVDVYLFDDKGSPEVDHVAVRGRKVRNIDEKICFASILSNPKSVAAKAKVVGPVRTKTAPPKPVAAVEPEPAPAPSPAKVAAPAPPKKPGIKRAVDDPIFEQPGLPRAIPD